MNVALHTVNTSQTMSIHRIIAAQNGLGSWPTRIQHFEVWDRGSLRKLYKILVWSFQSHFDTKGIEESFINRTISTWIWLSTLALIIICKHLAFITQLRWYSWHRWDSYEKTHRHEVPVTVNTCPKLCALCVFGSLLTTTWAMQYIVNVLWL